MPKKAATTISPHSDQKDVAAFINRAFDTGDLDEICKAIGTAAKTHNITDIAKKSGIKRASVYRALRSQTAFSVEYPFEERQAFWLFSARIDQSRYGRQNI